MHCTRLTWRQKYVGEVNKTWFHSKIRERARALVERRAKALAFKILRNLENFRMQGFRGFRVWAKVRIAKLVRNSSLYVL